MNDTKHTPGPWEAGMNGRHWSDVREASMAGQIAVVSIAPGLPSEAHANAHLIAAAPCLLAAAIRTVKEQAADMTSPPSVESFLQLHEAIERALGGSAAKATGSDDDA